MVGMVRGVQVADVERPTPAAVKRAGSDGVSLPASPPRPARWPVLERRKLATIAAIVLTFFFLPVGSGRFDGAVSESLHQAKWYAREHVLLCLVTASYTAGAIGVFISQASVMRYVGTRADKVLAYGVASVSGTILAVCSCTILPLFMGITACWGRARR